MRNDIHTESVVRYLINGKAYAVNANGPFPGNIATVLGRNLDNESNRAGIRLASLYLPYTIDMPADRRGALPG
jgi:hypothetical protein